jgi:hypothetical protein
VPVYLVVLVLTLVLVPPHAHLALLVSTKQPLVPLLAQVAQLVTIVLPLALPLTLLVPLVNTLLLVHLHAHLALLVNTSLVVPQVVAQLALLVTTVRALV